MGDYTSSAPPLLLGPLRRRNSISTSVVLPSKLSPLSSSTTPTAKPRHSCSFPPQNGTAATTLHHLRPPHLDLELLSLKNFESYTSLKDLLPSSSFAAVQSPTPNSASTQISIRNRLVKQAAWAYLQPVSSASGPSGPHFLRRLWLKCSTCLSRVLHRLLPCFFLS